METIALLCLALCVALLLVTIRYYERRVSVLLLERDFAVAQLRHPANRRFSA